VDTRWFIEFQMEKTFTTEIVKKKIITKVVGKSFSRPDCSVKSPDFDQQILERTVVQNQVSLKPTSQNLP
jgi:hypothetical protein